jgi:hypothetical protein
VIDTSSSKKKREIKAAQKKEDKGPKPFNDGTTSAKTKKRTRNPGSHPKVAKKELEGLDGFDPKLLKKRNGGNRKH